MGLSRWIWQHFGIFSILSSFKNPQSSLQFPTTTYLNKLRSEQNDQLNHCLLSYVQFKSLIYLYGAASLGESNVLLVSHHYGKFTDLNVTWLPNTLWRNLSFQGKQSLQWFSLSSSLQSFYQLCTASQAVIWVTVAFCGVETFELCNSNTGSSWGDIRIKRGLQLHTS